MTKNNFYIDEENYEKNMNEIVLPFLLQYEKSGFFKATDDINLFYRKFELENPKANIIIVHGFSEHTQRYNEFIYYLLKNNYSVYIYDQRCHGLSDRLCEKHNMVYVKNFSDYTRDLEIFFDNINIKNNISNQKIFLFGHSMGGAVVVDFLEQSLCKDKINFAFLSAPMLELATKPFSSREIDLYLKNSNEENKKYCPGQGDFNAKSRQSDPRYKEYAKFRYGFNFDINHPDLVANGASFGWFKEAVKITKKIMLDENLAKIKTPIALLQHGRDKFVSPGNQNIFASKVKNCKLYKLDNAEHCPIYMHNDISSVYFKKIIELFDSH